MGGLDLIVEKIMKKFVEAAILIVGMVTELVYAEIPWEKSCTQRKTSRNF